MIDHHLWFNRKRENGGTMRTHTAYRFLKLENFLRSRERNSGRKIHVGVDHLDYKAPAGKDTSMVRIEPDERVRSGRWAHSVVEPALIK